MEVEEDLSTADLSTADLSTADLSTDSLLKELHQLAEQTEQMCQQHQEALFIMNRIKEQMDQKETLYITKKDNKDSKSESLDTVLETLHADAMKQIEQTGVSNFGEAILATLSTCSIHA